MSWWHRPGAGYQPRGIKPADPPPNEGSSLSIPMPPPMFPDALAAAHPQFRLGYAQARAELEHVFAVETYNKGLK